MKPKMLLFLFFITCFSYTQVRSFELIGSFLTDTPAHDFWQVERKEKRLEDGLSQLMVDRVLRRSRAFRTNIAEIKRQVRGDQCNARLSIKLSMNLFDEADMYQFDIRKVSSLYGRTIMRGSIKDVPGSEVRLVEYNNSLTGMVNDPRSENALVVLSDGKGVSAAYEVDTIYLEYE